ncbi:MAG: hypothetical protein Q8P81_01690 [Nanoarchaeota archaeon]|nr:hypothetical protein [Nanoarchaeota archaeon]
MARSKPKIEQLFQADKEEALDALRTNPNVSEQGLDPDNFDFVTVNKEGLGLLETRVYQGREPEHIFFPGGAPSSRGGFLAIGQQSFISNITSPKSMKRDFFNESYRRINPDAEFVVAFPRDSLIARTITSSFQKPRAVTESKVSEAVDSVSKTVELCDPRMASQVEAQGLTDLILNPGENMKGVPEGVINPGDVGIGDFIDPINYLTSVLHKDGPLFYGVTDRFSRAWNRLHTSKSIRVGKKDAAQATLVMLRLIEGMHSYDRQRPEGEPEFTLPEYIRSAFAALMLDIGLCIKSDKIPEGAPAKNHALVGATLYRLLARKDGDFTGIVDPEYGQVILRHHAGLGDDSCYPIPRLLGAGDEYFLPGSLPRLKPDNPLAPQIQLAFINGTLYSRLRQWRIDDETQANHEALAKDLGWRSNEQMTSFEVMNWLKESSKKGNLTMRLLDQEARARGVYPAGSEITLHQKDAQNRVRGRHDLNGFGGRVMPSGIIEIRYDSSGDPVYEERFIDLRRTGGEQFALKLKRI